MVERWHQCNQTRKKLDITEQARIEAQKVIDKCIFPGGIKASAHEDGYPQQWRRDLSLTSLGVLTLPEEIYKTSVKNGISTLNKAQTPEGQNPASVVIASGRSDFRSYADAGPWQVISQGIYDKATDDTDFLAENWQYTKNSLSWLKTQDVYQKGLIVQQEASDWMDMMPVTGMGLYTNVLYYQSLKEGSRMAGKLGETTLQDEYTQRANRARDQLQKDFWVDLNQSYSNDLFCDEEDNIIRGIWDSTIRELPHFVWYRSFRDTSARFDTMGNSLAIITGVATPEQTNKILDYADAVGIAEPYPAKALYPAIHPGDYEWRKYLPNRNLNLPNHYHNGGSWPVVAGIYVCAQVAAGRYQEAENGREKLALFNKQGRDEEWGHHEYGHGQTGRPMGVKQQAWSAAAFLLADEAVKQRKVPFFGETEIVKF